MGGMPGAPVEYGVAVERFLADAALGEASRRVYRISLIGWAWPLVGLEPPVGVERRGARAPVVPLAVLDDEGVGGRLAAAVPTGARRSMPARSTGSCRRCAAPSAGGRTRAGSAATRRRGCGCCPGRRVAAPLTERQVAELFRADVPLRERALWQLLRDTGVPAPVALGLDASEVVRVGAVHRAASVPGAQTLERARRAAGLAAVRALDRARLPYRP